jgi:hypothetical protein
MAFPSSPVIGEEYDESGIRFYWDGTVWRVKGHVGPAGPTGAAGIQGIQGIQGLRGIQGLQGLLGLQGIQGPVGPPGSGGNADTLDSLDSTAFLRSDVADTANGLITFAGGSTYGSGSEDRRWTTADTDIDGLIPGTGGGRLSTSSTNAHYVIGIKSNDANDGFYVLDQGDVGTTGNEPYINTLLAASRAQFQYLGNSIWHAGNFDPATKANLSGANFTGTITLANTQPTFDMVESDTTTGALRAIVSGGISYLQSGTTVSPNGGLYFTGKTANDIGAFRVRHSGAYRDIWHAGNFDPATKANLSGATFTGTTIFDRGLGVQSSTANTTIIDGTYGLRFVPRAGAGNFNGGVQANDALIYFHEGTSGTGALSIAPWSTTNATLRITAAGGLTFAGNNIWHAGNFDPATKANLSGATFTGNVTINSPNILSFGSTTRQMITLWGTTFGIGVQNSTHYFRTGANGKFSWFMNGVHSNTENDPGAGGTVLMRLSSTGLDVGGNTVWHAGNDGVSSTLDAGLLGGVASANFVRGTTANRTGSIVSGNWNNALPSGFFEADGGTNAPSTGWWWGFNFRHSNTSNQYGWQMLGQINQNNYRLRYVSNGTWSSWVPVAVVTTSGATSGNISSGTAAPGTLANGEIYLRYA